MDIKAKLKKVLIEELNLEGLTPEDIQDDAPIFREGLGLDSLDAVEIVMLLKKHFGVEIKNMEDSKPAFQSINTLSAFIAARTQA